MENIKAYVQQHKDRFINELIELLKIPSVSADTAYSQDVIDTAEAVKVSLEKAKFCDLVEVCDTPGYPIIYGEKIIDPNLPTVLVYGHYDVQCRIQWSCGHHHHSNPLSKRLKFTRKEPFSLVVPAMTKGKCTCT